MSQAQLKKVICSLYNFQSQSKLLFALHSLHHTLLLDTYKINQCKDKIVISKLNGNYVENWN